MIQVPAFVTVPARTANIQLEPIMGGAYSSLRGLGQDEGDGIDWTKIITAGTQAATQIINANRQPYVVPGTPGLVYNPATGQVGTTLGTTASQASLGLMPYVIGGVALLVLVLVLVKK